MKKSSGGGLVIITVMIALIIGVWTGIARASAEEDMFTATTQPDAMILLDLSGSMGDTPSGGYKYGSSTACTANATTCAGVSSTYHYSSNTAGTADTVNCAGAPDRSNYPYSSNDTCTADATNCVGSVISPYPTYPYARDAQHPNTADTSNCNYSDCSHGFCQTSHNRCSALRGTLCSGGFCRTSTSSCDVNCNYDCSGGFCATAKPGCDIDLSSSRCSGGFCQDNTQSDCNVDCSKLAIAKRSIYSFLDDNNDGQITVADKTSLGVRMGYMRFYNCSSSSQETGSSPTYNYSTGCNTLIQGIDSPYSTIYCGSSTSCSSSSAGSGTSGTVSGEGASGGTPLSVAEGEAKLYLDWHKSQDAAGACRNKFAILITDGSDTYACNANGSTTNAPQRRESVAKAKALADAGYKVFVIGFGASMAADQKNTLNWMAYYGRTDDPNTGNTGDPTSYSVASGALYPAGVAACSTSSSNDPGLSTLAGYAYIAADADALAAALRATINIIRQANYSFSQSSIQASRTTDENFLYEGSFEPADSSEPFWKGHLKKYQINSDGSVGSVSWDAGTLLQNQSDTSRNILTYTSALTAFNTTNITASLLGVATDDERTAVIGYIRGNPDDNPEVASGSLPWKLGDVFRSTPITIGTPSIAFNDTRDCNNQFAAHRTAHPRTSANGLRLIAVGANDGQLHGFKTSDGSEAWSFIPPNLLPKLKNMTHSLHPPNQSHQYFDDGPITVADVWNGSAASGCGSSCGLNGECKAANSWKTIMVFGEGRGSVDYAWSSSASCNTGLSGNYSVTAGSTTTTYPYYCGYYALDVTDSLNPGYLWHLNFVDSTARTNQAPYLGDPWSKMMIGRVRVKESGVEKEKWVGFIGAGYNGSDCTGSGACDTRGKGFFVVDLTSGNIIWSFTQGSSSSATTSTAMKYSMPATPAIADTDGDGFIDTAYIGDLGGNMWRFAFCRDQDMPNCGISGQSLNWSGGKFFDATAGSGNSKSIYTLASVAKDANGNVWVYWGTGNKIAPTAKTGIQEYFYAVKDGRPSTAYNADNLTNMTASSTSTYTPSSGTAGYRIQLAGSDTGEKVLADVTTFGGVVYFTTYTPSAGTDACNQSGDAKLYALNFTTGGGVIPGDNNTSVRSKTIGSGIPSAPVISMKPGSNPAPDLYVTTSGTGGGVSGTTVTSASTQRVNFDPPGAASRTNLLYWRDRRIQ